MEETMVMNDQQPVENKKVNKNNTWNSVVMGGISGIVLGSVTAASVAASKAEENDVITLNGVSGVAHVDGSVPVAQVNDDMSFSQAFHSAYEQVGPGGVFVWHGQLYGTFTAEEWNSMTPAEQAEFGSHVYVLYNEPSHTLTQSTAQEAPALEVVADSTNTDQHSEQDTHEENTNSVTTEQQEDQVDVQETLTQQSTSTDNVSEGEDALIGGISPAEPEIEVLSYETISINDGSQVDVAVVSANDQEMGVYDVNQDGIADFVAMDANNNLQIDSNEINDISSQGYSMQSLHDNYIAENDPSMQGPDYINDANVDNYMA